MCLTDYKKIDLSRKRKPIACYKVFEKFGGRFDSPLYPEGIHGMYWEVGKVRRIGVEKCRSSIHSYRDTITCDAFHSLKSFSDAKKYKKWLEEGNEREFVIAKCKIPLDSNYVFEGMAVVSSEDAGVPGYASESIKIEEFV